TTFTTPFFIKCAPSCIKLIEKRLPDRVLARLNRYTAEDQAESEKDNDWQLYIVKYFKRVTVFGGLMLAIAVFITYVAEPVLSAHMKPQVSSVISCAVIYAGIALFTGPLMNFHNDLYTSLWLKKRSFRLPLTVLNLIKVGIIAEMGRAHVCI